MSTEAPANPLPATPGMPPVQKAPTPPPTSTPPADTYVSPEAQMSKGIKELWKDASTTLTPSASTKDLKNEPPKPKEVATPPVAVVPPVAADPAEKKTASVFDKTKPAEVVPPVEVDPFAHVKAPEGMTEKSMEGWAALKKEASAKIKAAEAAAALKAGELETLKKATPAEYAELDRLKAEHKAAMDRLAVLDIQAHPDFAKQYSEPKTKALAEAKEVLGWAGKDGADLTAILGKSGKDFSAAVTELTAGLNAMDASTVQTALRQAYKISADEKAALSNSSALRGTLESRTAAEQKKAFGDTWGKFGGAENFITPVEIPEGAAPEEKAELEAYNQQVAATRANAESYAFGRVDPSAAASIASKAAILDTMVKVVVPRMEKEYGQVLKERNAFAAELKAIKEAKNPGNFTKTSTPPSADPKQAARDALRAAFPKG